MLERRVQLTIAADTKTCGKCRFRRTQPAPDTRDISVAKAHDEAVDDDRVTSCSLFRKPIVRDERVAECLSAEERPTIMSAELEIARLKDILRHQASCTGLHTMRVELFQRTMVLTFPSGDEADAVARIGAFVLENGAAHPTTGKRLREAEGLVEDLAFLTHQLIFLMHDVASRCDGGSEGAMALREHILGLIGAIPADILAFAAQVHDARTAPPSSEESDKAEPA